MYEKTLKASDPGDTARTRDEGELIKNAPNRPENYENTCQRPIGECELGGCCDVCWFRPDHPRFKENKGD